MPVCGSQVWLCDMPIRFDTYKGCSHGCAYCFAKKNRNIEEIEFDETAKTLKTLCEGHRNRTTAFADWNVPIHWGGMSDPFQPCEREHKRSYDCLKVLAETQYPYVVSTKGEIIAEEKYINVIRETNGVVQISMCCSKYDILEPGAPTFEKRLKMLDKLSANAKRTIVRVQPYMCETFSDVFKNIKRFAEAGAYGVTFEGLKLRRKKGNMVKLEGDFVYPLQELKAQFSQLKEECHANGLQFYSGENRLRAMGDSLTCCGVDGLKGFKPNEYNLNHLLRGEDVKPTEAMKRVGTAEAFQTIYMTTTASRMLRNMSFDEAMRAEYKRRPELIKKALGVN